MMFQDKTFTGFALFGCIRSDCIENLCAEGENRTPYASLFRSFVDYIIIRPLVQQRSWALMRGYRWDSPASLYTFRKTYALPGLARDCS